MKPLVLHVVRRAAGGLRRHVTLLVGAFAAQPYRVAVAGALDRAWAEELAVCGAVVHPCHPFSLPALCRRLRPVLVHAHGYRAALWCRALPRHRVATAHNLPGHFLGDRGAVWLAVSHAVALALAARGVAVRRLHVLPPACAPPAAQAKDAARRRLGVPPAAPTVAFVGRLVPEKGLDLLAEAFAQLRLVHPEAVLLVAGRGPSRPLPAPGVQLLGHLDDPADVYAAADVVALPSRREGLGLAALEAQAAGRPVVAAATGGLPEVIRHGVDGWLVPPGDPLALFAALERLLAAPDECARLGRAAQSLSARRTVAGLAQSVRQVYDLVLSR